MKENSLKEQIEAYVYNEHINQAILLHGEWGSGKTYFIKEVLAKNKKLDLIYSSANGISSEQSIILQIFSHSIKGSQKKQSKSKKVISSLLSGVLKLGFEKIGGDTEKFNYLDLISFEKNTVLIVDDIERLDPSYNIESFLGFITSLTEHEKLKVILIGEEDELKKRNEDIAKRYSIIKEKHIFRTLAYRVNLKDAIQNLMQLYSKESEYYKFLIDNIDLIIDIWESLKVKNLRTIKYFLDSFFIIYQIAPKKINKIKRHIITTTIVLSKEYKETELLKIPVEPPDYLSRSFPSVTSSIQRKAIEAAAENEKSTSKFPSKFKLNHANYYLLSNSLYRSIFLGQTINSDINFEIEEFLKPKDETAKWNIALNKVKSFRIIQHKVLKEEYDNCIEYIKKGAYDIYQLSHFVNFSIEFIERKMISRFRKVSSFCKFIKKHILKSFNVTKFEFSKFSRLTIEKVNDYQSLKDLSEEFNNLNKMVVSGFTQTQILEVKSLAKSNLEDVTDQNILFIMRKGNLKDLDYFATILTSDISNVNLAYDLMAHSQIKAQQEFEEYKAKLKYLLTRMKRKAKNVDKIVEYVVDEIIDKFKL